ncbi:MAG: type III pantothenate kinase [Acholeplasmataceae bacterium]
MILLFDVGNTNISFGVSDGFKILDTYRLNTIVSKTADEYYIQMKNVVDFSLIKQVAISSVVPRITEKLVEISKHYLNINPLVIEPGIKTGINIKTDHPREIGADLICGAAGIVDHQKPTLIVDLGTAIKYIYVKDKTITGVIITPGVSISIKALVSNTALLPDIDIVVPKKVLGTNTVHCMQSGVTYGVAAQVDGLIDRIYDETKESFNILLTGGLSSTIAPLCKHPLERDPDLVLKGLYQIFVKNHL